MGKIIRRKTTRSRKTFCIQNTRNKVVGRCFEKRSVAKRELRIVRRKIRRRKLS